jgi:hypothetical protein
VKSGFRTMAFLFCAMALLCCVSAGNANANAATLNCRAQVQNTASQFRVNTPLQQNARILDLRPEELCKANRNAPGNQRVGGNNIQDSKVCETSYEHARAAVRDYITLAEEACKHTAGLDLSNVTGGGALTAEAVRKAKDAAEANLAAARKLEEARAQVNEFGQEASKLRDRYKADLDKIMIAEANYEADRVKFANDPAKLAELENTRRTTDTIVNGRYSAKEGGTGILGVISGPDVVAARRGNASTISSYRELLPTTQRGIGLLSEQQLAFETAQAFDRQAQREIDARTQAAQNLQRYATNLDPVARRGTESIVTGSSSSQNSSLPNLNNAMAMTQAGAGLANTLKSQQQAAAPAGAAAANSNWNDIGAAAQTIAGLSGGGSKPGTSKIGGDANNGGEGKTVPGNVTKDPKESDRINPDSPEGSFGVASNGDVFVSGNNDLPPLGSTASRTPSSDARGKLGEGGGAEARAYGKKRKGEGKGEEQAACPPGQDCAALAAGGASFSKGGSLGVPVVGAADPGLNAVGALDNLFGEIPGLDGAGGAEAGTAASGGIFGFGSDSPLAEVSGGTEDGGKQGSVEVAPANSRSLFARVKVVHERALKKGAVSLFHKKL